MTTTLNENAVDLAGDANAIDLEVDIVVEVDPLDVADTDYLVGTAADDSLDVADG